VDVSVQEIIRAWGEVLLVCPYNLRVPLLGEVGAVFEVATKPSGIIVSPLEDVVAPGTVIVGLYATEEQRLLRHVCTT
jgi:hypothetical protein